MRTIKMIIDGIIQPWKVIAVMGTSGIGRIIPDKLFLKCKYRYLIGKKLRLNNPTTFNEKLQWLKLHYRNPIFTKMVDKYEVKKYVSNIIGDEYIIPTLGIWDRFDEIDFDALPTQFVLKCTHDSAGIVIVKDKSKLDKETAKKKLENCLKKNFYYWGREWPYKNVPPRIIAEKYMEDTKTAELRDYKFFCFGGQAKCIKVDFDRFVEHRANYFDADGNLMKVGEQVCPPDFSRAIELPDNFELMKKLSETLSEGIPFVRSDFYDVDGKVYFGEMTFYPAAGFGKFIYDGNDELLGSWIQLPDKLGGVLH